MQLRHACALLALTLVCLPLWAEDVIVPIATPEPASALLLAGGLGGLILAHRKFRKKG